MFLFPFFILDKGSKLIPNEKNIYEFDLENKETNLLKTQKQLIYRWWERFPEFLKEN